MSIFFDVFIEDAPLGKYLRGDRKGLILIKLFEAKIRHIDIKLNMYH